MSEALKSEKTIREYLLGRVSDETTLEGIEELLFTDEEFCSQVTLTEDSIINEYVFGHLDEADAASFQATLASDPERCFKLALTRALMEKALAEKSERAKKRTAPALLASLKEFFRQPKYVAALAVLLLVVCVSAIYLFRNGRPDELAELRSIYGRERPTETRISGFDYAPLLQLRGAPETNEKNRLRRIGSRLIETTEERPNAQTLHALGVFYLTQGEYADAVREFESALKFDDKNARIHNDLGAACFELAKSSGSERRLEWLGRALEQFTTATDLDANSLEALFNRALALQELGLSRQAKDAWTLYLQRDASSSWAAEARRNLSRIEGGQASFKTDEQVLQDFLAAFRSGDEARAQQIHNETKGLLRGATVPLQLSRRYLLAKLAGDDASAKESLAAMDYIGSFEQSRHADFFFLNWPRSMRATEWIGPRNSCKPKNSSTPVSVSCSTAAPNASGAIT